MKILNIISLALIIIGAVNWGLLGFFQFDLVAAIFGDMSVFSRVIYSLIGIVDYTLYHFLLKIALLTNN